MNSPYIATDLDITSDSDLQYLADGASKEVRLQYIGRNGTSGYIASFGLWGASSEDESVQIYSEFLKSFDPETVLSFDQIVFKFGYRPAEGVECGISSIGADTLEIIAALGGKLDVYIYGTEGNT